MRIVTVHLEARSNVIAAKIWPKQIALNWCLKRNRHRHRRRHHCRVPVKSARRRNRRSSQAKRIKNRRHHRNVRRGEIIAVTQCERFAVSAAPDANASQLMMMTTTTISTPNSSSTKEKWNWIVRRVVEAVHRATRAKSMRYKCRKSHFPPIKSSHFTWMAAKRKRLSRHRCQRNRNVFDIESIGIGTTVCAQTRTSFSRRSNTIWTAKVVWNGTSIGEQKVDSFIRLKMRFLQTWLAAHRCGIVRCMQIELLYLHDSHSLHLLPIDLSTLNYAPNKLYAILWLVERMPHECMMQFNSIGFYEVNCV